MNGLMESTSLARGGFAGPNLWVGYPNLRFAGGVGISMTTSDIGGRCVAISAISSSTYSSFSSAGHPA